jgi:diguanylate cyclase (GGDEF)-like protein
MRKKAIRAVERSRQPSWTWVLACVGALLLLALLDSATGPELTLAPLYVIPVALATWFAGLQRGLPVALAAVAAWVWGQHTDPAVSDIAMYVLNVLVRAIAYVAVALLVAGMRWALLRYLPHLTASDCLSGVLGAAQFREVVSLELAGAHRNASPLSCAYLEVKGFHLVSERHGPVMAILVLSALASCIRRCLRRADVVGRFGAERFVVLLPQICVADASAVVQRLRTEFTASIGFCPATVDLSIAMLSYEIPPATLDELIRDIEARVGSSRSSGEASHGSVGEA